jgi:hypothetical protein
LFDDWFGEHMLKMAELEFGTGGKNVLLCYFKDKKDIILISSKSCSKSNTA